MAEEKNEIQENNNPKEQIKKVIQIPLKEILALVTVIVIIVGIIIVLKITKKEPKKEIISESSLQEIINVSELSTYETVYNGVAKVTDNYGDIQYYVSYDARVKAGIDFAKVEIDVDNENKKISVIIPDIEINDVTVDIESLDYIFVNDKANTGTVSQEAYKVCIEDVKNESATQTAIFDLAAQNAQNVVEALIKPFVSQLDSEYVLEIN